jgi:hypothetical protein
MTMRSGFLCCRVSWLQALICEALIAGLRVNRIVHDVCLKAHNSNSSQRIAAQQHHCATVKPAVVIVTGLG